MLYGVDNDQKGPRRIRVEICHPSNSSPKSYILKACVSLNISFSFSLLRRPFRVPFFRRSLTDKNHCKLPSAKRKLFFFLFELTLTKEKKYHSRRSFVYSTKLDRRENSISFFWYRKCMKTEDIVRFLTCSLFF